MTPALAIESAKKGDLLPVYVVVGEEEFLRDQVVAELRASCLSGAIAAFNEDRFTAGEGDTDKIFLAARTLPMMAKKRFVCVRGADRWDAGAAEDSEKTANAGLDRLAEYAADPSPSTCLVIVAQKLDGRRKLTLLSKKKDFLVSCDPLDARSLARFIDEQCQARGNPIHADVAGFLAELVGPELAKICDSIERLSLYVGNGNPITENAVSTCIARVRTADTWGVVSAVGARNLAAALRTLADAYDPRDRGLPLLGALAWSIRQLARFQAEVATGANAEEAARRAGVYQPFRARELASRAKAFRGKELERWLLVLAEADLALKSSRRPADAILEEMLTQLCGPGRSASASG